MPHEGFRESMMLSLYGELDADREEELQAHLGRCPECRKELRKLGALVSTLDAQDGVSEELLLEARRDLADRLRAESVGVPTGWRTRSVALTAAASLLLGCWIGFWFSSGTGAGPGVADYLMDPEVGLVSVEFLEPEHGDGEIELAVRAARPLRLKGRVEDPAILRVLSRTLATSPSPADRLQAVYSFAGLDSSAPVPSARSVLVQSLKFDSSVAVRRGALEILRTRPPDPEVGNALLYVVANDPHPAMRIAALEAIRAGARPSDFDPRMVQDLEDGLGRENNRYVRVQAEALLQEWRETHD